MINSIREHFPIFKNNDFIYFDNAATTQKPRFVIEKVKEFVETTYANVHRGSYKEALEATERYEKAREHVAKFINAEPEQIVFTKNATESINLVAYGLRKKYKTCAVSVAEHHSNFVPWQQLYDFFVLPIKENGEIITNVKNKDIYAFTHVSNVIGNINNVKEIMDFVKEQKAISLLDASQSINHIKIDVKKLDVDFLVFSGHKMMAFTGIGVLYMKEPILDPFLFGGQMVSHVSEKITTFGNHPRKYEAGTPPIIEAISLDAAITFIESIGYEKMMEIEKKLTRKMIKGFEELSIKILGQENENRVPIFSFNVGNLHGHDVEAIFASKNIALRSGFHCAEPLHKFLGYEKGTVRASLYIYNNEEEINKFFEVLEKIKSMAEKVK
jgi:cysteine desulfurase/selenocysteine lyase